MARIAASSSATVPKASRVPCTKTAGMVIAEKCAVRSSRGRSGGWSG
jgi:hypothetical protein